MQYAVQAEQFDQSEELDPLDVIKCGPIEKWDRPVRSGSLWTAAKPERLKVTRRISLSLIHMPTGIQVFGSTGPGGIPDGSVVMSESGLERYLWVALGRRVAEWRECRRQHPSLTADNTS